VAFSQRARNLPTRGSYAKLRFEDRTELPATAPCLSIEESFVQGLVGMDQIGWGALRAARGASNSRVLAGLTKMLETQSKEMEDALTDFGEQLKGGEEIDEITFDRAYWYAGYVSAVQNVLRTITRV
jgi:hypothetical protein